MVISFVCQYCKRDPKSVTLIDGNIPQCSVVCSYKGRLTNTIWSVIARLRPSPPPALVRSQMLVILADSVIDDAININTGKLCVLNKYETRCGAVYTVGRGGDTEGGVLYRMRC